MLAISLILGCSGPATIDTDVPTVDTGADVDALICSRAADAFADLDEGAWTGDSATCDAGEMPQAGIDNAMRVLNYARNLARVASVTHNEGQADVTQACAVLMDANDSLSHQPPDTWDCYTPEAGTTAGRSLLAREPAVGAMMQYLVDFGNETTLVHRRWLLNPSIENITLGSTDAFSCLRLGTTTFSSTGWIAWPPPGRVPLSVLSESNSSVDAEGWSIQSDDIDLSNASVTVTVDGEVFPQTVEVLEPNQGSRYAIRFLPSGFSSVPGRYTVDVTGAGDPFFYSVVIVDCEE